MSNHKFEYPFENVLFMGDTHGNMQFIAHALTRYVSERPLDLVIQVGDFGYWPHFEWGRKFLRQLSELLVELDIELVWVRGNHENQDMLSAINGGDLYGSEILETRIPGDDEQFPNIGWIPDGAVFSIDEGIRSVNLMGFGGAVSPDRPYRIGKAGTEYWHQEEITWGQTNFANREEIEPGSIDILVAHEGSSFVAKYRRLGGPGFPMPPSLELECAQGPKFVADVLDHHQIPMHIHGHYHNRYVYFGDRSDKGVLTSVGLSHDDGHRYVDSIMRLSDLLDAHAENIRRNGQ